MIDIFLVISIYTYNKIHSLENKNNADNAFALYIFYYKTAKLQKTNQPWATVAFCQKGLGWGDKKVKQARRDLLELKLIKDLPGIGKDKTYVKIRYMVSKTVIADFEYYDEND